MLLSAAISAACRLRVALLLYVQLPPLTPSELDQTEWHMINVCPQEETQWQAPLRSVGGCMVYERGARA